MKFAINYSEAAAQLMREDRIQLDRFKCPPWPGMIAEASQLCPVAVHFDLKAGQNRLGNVDWDLFTSLLEQTGTPFINIHLECVKADFPGISVEASGHAVRQAVLERMLADVQQLVDRYGAEQVIVENVPYRGLQGKAMRPSVEPEVICEIVEATGCGLLLDLSHARIAARALGMDEEAYLAQLPVSQIRELHFTGLHRIEDRWQDHLEALDADWIFLEWALEQIRNGEWSRPWMMAFEYGGVGEKFAWRSDPTYIAQQAPRLLEMVASI